MKKILIFFIILSIVFLITIIVFLFNEHTSYETDNKLVVFNETMAIAIGKTIFKEHFDYDGNVEVIDFGDKWLVFEILYDNSGNIILKNSYHIEIRKNDGKILSIYLAKEG